MDGSNNNDTFNGGNGGAQARVPVEAVQEFQLLTSQFDAEYGLASGGIVNSVSKQGTNQLPRQRVLVLPGREAGDATTTSPSEQGLEEAADQAAAVGRHARRADRQGQGALLRQPRARRSWTRGVTTNIPTRPDLNRTDFESTRVWNTFLRADHQINAANTWGVRWLRETSPQPLQIQDVNHTPSRHEAETDIDWTVVGNLSSVIGSTKVNTFRVSAVSEDVFFGNPNFNSNGHDQKILLPQLNYLSFQDQQSSRANRRLDVAYGADDVFAWFMPGKGGDHDLKFGVNYLYSTLRVQDYGNMNGTFTHQQRPAVRPEQSAHLSRTADRSACPMPLDFTMKGHFIGMFAQDKWKLRNNLTLSLGAALRLRDPADAEPGQPAVRGRSRRLSEGHEQHLASPRLLVGARRATAARRCAAGSGVFYQRTSYTFLTNMFGTGAGFRTRSRRTSRPTTSTRVRGTGTSRPTRGWSMARPSITALIDALFPPGSRIRNGGTVRFDNPDRKLAWSRQYSLGYERQIGSTIGLSVDFIRSEQRNQYILKELNPGVRDSRAGDRRSHADQPARRRRRRLVRASVVTLANDGWIDYNTIQVSGTKRYSQQLARAPVVRVVARPGQHAGRPGRTDAALAVPRRPAARHRSRTDQRGSPAHPDRCQARTMCREPAG